MQKRKLGYWESACALIHDELNATGLMFTRIQVEGNISFDDFQASLKRLFYRHPLLRATIRKEEEYYYLYEDANYADIPIYFFPFSQTNEIEVYIETMLRAPLESSRYLWQAILFTKGTQNEILVFFHHSIADGMSSIEFTDELLTNLSQKDFSEQGIESLPLLDPIEKLVNQSIKSGKNQVKAVPASKIYYQKQATLEERVTKNIFTLLKSSELKQIKQSCKENGITINSFICTAFMMAIRKIFPEIEVLEITTPVNLRAYVIPPISSEHIGCYMTCFSLLINLDNDFLAIAQEYQLKLKQAITELSKLPEELNLSNIEITSGLVDVEHAKKRNYFPAGVAVTNKGQSKLKRYYGQLKLRGYFTASSRQAGDIAVNLSLTTVEDEVYCCFTYAEPLICSEKIQALMTFFSKACLS